MFNKHDISRNEYMLTGGLSKCGYDWWWHSFTAKNKKTGKEKPFYIEFFLCNPSLGKDKPIYGQIDNNKPSYLMVNVGTWGKDHKQLHRFFGWNEVDVSKGVPYYVKADNCYITENETYGEVNVTESSIKNHPEYMSDSGTIKWNLKINKKIAFSRVWCI